MAKKDDIILIIAKSFGKQKLNKEEVEICKSLSVVELISEYGLTQDQSQEVIKWCTISCSSLPNSSLLEENFFKRLFSKNKKNKSKIKEKSAREIYVAFMNYMKNYSDDLNTVGEFLFNARNFNDLVAKKGLHTAMKNPKAKIGSVSGAHLDLIDAASGDTKFLNYDGVPAKYQSDLSELIRMTVRIYKASLESKKYLRLVKSSKVTSEAFAPARSREELYDRVAGRNEKKKDYFKFLSTFMNAVNKKMFGKSASKDSISVEIAELVETISPSLEIYTNNEKLLLLKVVQKFTLRLCHALDKNIKETIKSSSSHYYDQ